MIFLEDKAIFTTESAASTQTVRTNKCKGKMHREMPMEMVSAGRADPCVFPETSVHFTTRAVEPAACLCSMQKESVPMWHVASLIHICAVCTSKFDPEKEQTKLAS